MYLFFFVIAFLSSFMSYSQTMEKGDFIFNSSLGKGNFEYVTNSFFYIKNDDLNFGRYDNADVVISTCPVMYDVFFRSDNGDNIVGSIPLENIVVLGDDIVSLLVNDFEIVSEINVDVFNNSCLQKLRYISLDGNSFYGKIDLGNLKDLIYFSINNNAGITNIYNIEDVLSMEVLSIEGTSVEFADIMNQNLPNTIKYIDMSNISNKKKYEGDIDFSNLELTTLDISYNGIVGNLKISSESMDFLNISNNKFLFENLESLKNVTIEDKIFGTQDTTYSIVHDMIENKLVVADSYLEGTYYEWYSNGELYKVTEDNYIYITKDLQEEIEVMITNKYFEGLEYIATYNFNKGSNSDFVGGNLVMSISKSNIDKFRFVFDTDKFLADLHIVNAYGSKTYEVINSNEHISITSSIFPVRGTYYYFFELKNKEYKILKKYNGYIEVIK